MVPPSIHRMVIALLDAVDAGFLRGRTWVVEVEGDPEIPPALLWPYMRLFKAMDHLWGPSVMPEEILLKTKSGWARFDIGASEPPVACKPPVFRSSPGRSYATPPNRLRHSRATR